MTTIELTKEYIREMVATNPNWTERAVVAIYRRQTEDEQASEQTKHLNAIGFNGLDAGILSSFARRIQGGRHLTEKQLAVAQKLMPKYAGQLFDIAKESTRSS